MSEIAALILPLRFSAVSESLTRVSLGLANGAASRRSSAIRRSLTPG